MFQSDGVRYMMEGTILDERERARAERGKQPLANAAEVLPGQKRSWGSDSPHTASPNSDPRHGPEHELAIMITTIEPVPIVRTRPTGPFPWPVWLPPEAYTPEPPKEARRIVAPDGPTTSTVQGVLGSRTCGYSLRPTAADLTEGLRRIDAGEPLDTVAYNAVTAWMHEADDREMVVAWLKGAYRLDSLVRAIFAIPIRRHDRMLATALCFPRLDWTGD